MNIKRIEEKSRELGDKYFDDPHAIFDDGFKAGVEFAKQWISVDDELPEIKNKRYQIHVKYKSGIDIYDTLAIEPSICTKENLYHIMSEFKITYWRPIERK